MFIGYLYFPFQFLYRLFACFLLDLFPALLCFESQGSTLHFPGSLTYCLLVMFSRWKFLAGDGNLGRGEPKVCLSSLLLEWLCLSYSSSSCLDVHPLWFSSILPPFLSQGSSSHRVDLAAIQITPSLLCSSSLLGSSSFL